MGARVSLLSAALSKGLRVTIGAALLAAGTRAISQRVIYDTPQVYHPYGVEITIHHVSVECPAQAGHDAFQVKMNALSAQMTAILTEMSNTRYYGLKSTNAGSDEGFGNRAADFQTLENQAHSQSLLCASDDVQLETFTNERDELLLLQAQLHDIYNEVHRSSIAYNAITAFQQYATIALATQDVLPLPISKEINDLIFDIGKNVVSSAAKGVGCPGCPDPPYNSLSNYLTTQNSLRDIHTNMTNVFTQ